MNDNNFSEKNNSDNTEYRYTRDNIPHHSYIDANYHTDKSDKGSFYTAPQNSEDSPDKKEKKPKGEKSGFGKFIAACLVCALLGGAAGGGLVYAFMPSGSNGSGSGLNIAQSTSSGNTSVPKVDGSVLTGSQIYALGCEQAVGISTEITYTNFLGVQSSSAVSGSGFIVTEDGYIVTNYHVIEEAFKGGYDISVILYNGESHKAEIVGVEDDNDIAVLKIDVSGLPAVTLGSSKDLMVGDTVYAIGNPLGELSFSMTSGMVSALDREITTGTGGQNEVITTNNMFQIDAAVNEGNSGGPVYNDKGQVIGIVTAKYADTGVEGLGFAIPIDDVTEIINDLMQKGYVTGKAYLGITVNTVSTTVAQYYNMVEGAYVMTVADGSCSQKAGLKVGDIITAVNDAEVKSSSDLITAKRKFAAGETISLKVYRNGEYVDVKVTLDEEQPGSAKTTPESNENNNQQGGNTQPNNGQGDNGSLPIMPKS